MGSDMSWSRYRKRDLESQVNSPESQDTPVISTNAYDQPLSLRASSAAISPAHKHYSLAHQLSKSRRSFNSRIGSRNRLVLCLAQRVIRVVDRDGSIRQPQAHTAQFEGKQT